MLDDIYFMKQALIEAGKAAERGEAVSYTHLYIVFTAVVPVGLWTGARI